MLGIQERSLLFLEILLELFFLLCLFLQFFFGLLELLPLLFSDFNSLRAGNHFLLHLLESVEELHLLRLRLLFVLLSLLDFLKNSLLLFFLEVGLILNLFSIFLCLASDFFLLFSESGLNLCHLLLVLDVHDFLNDVGISKHSSLLHQLGWVHAVIQQCQLLAEFRDLVLILSKQRIFRIFIDLRLVLDVLGTRGIPESVHGLIIVVVGRTDIRNHQSLGVTTERILQQSCQLRVTIRNVRRLWVRQGRDDVTECRQREVDLRGFLQPVSGSACLGNTLRTRKIHHVQFTSPDVLLAISTQLGSLDGNLEKTMRSAGGLVHLSRADGTILHTNLKHVVDLGH